MCGILGTLPANKTGVFHTALSRLAHRGPDGEGIWHEFDNKITLGHRRLAIIDLSADGAQPMHYHDLALTYNGEIYNYPELRKELEGKGYRFTTTSDSEVILAAYMQWGPECLTKFNGMWAFAIWDNTKKELFLARDRFGKKPLFHVEVEGQFIFASEMKAILPFIDNPQPAKDFQRFVKGYDTYESTGECLVEGIKRFPAGHYGYYRDGKLQIYRYWDTLDHLVEVPDSYEQQVEQFRELMLDATRIRLRADVKVSCALSGGVDSSAVMAAIHENIKRDGNGHFGTSYTATFPKTKIDERIYAEQVLEYFDTEGRFVEIEGAKALQNLDTDLYHFEEVYRTPPSPMMRLYEAYRHDGSLVSLDGHGPDELLCGYGNFIFMAFLDTNPFNFKDIGNILSTYQSLYPTRENFFGINSTGWHNYFLTNAWHRMQHIGPHETADRAKHSDAIKRMGDFNYGLYKLFHYSIFPTLLRNFDRYSMRSGVEIRMPFADHRVVTYCNSLPWRSKLNKGYTKTILRDAVAPILSKSIAYRKTKIGFTSPLATWFKGPWKQYLEDTINSSEFKNCNLIDAASVQRAYTAFKNNPNATVIGGEELWLKLSPYLWEKSFLKNPLNHINP